MHRCGHDDARACRSVAPIDVGCGGLARRLRGLCPLEVREAILQQDAEKEAPPDEVEANQNCGVQITM